MQEAGETQKMNALKGEDQQSNVSETGDLRAMSVYSEL